MDLKTLIVSNLLLSLAMGALVLIYRRRHRGLGFGLWGAGALAIAAGFFALVLRAAGLPLTASVLGVNACFAFGAALRLDGISWFIAGGGCRERCTCCRRQPSPALPGSCSSTTASGCAPS